MFFFATSPCCGHYLNCFARKGYSHRRMLFSQDYFTQYNNGRNSFFKDFICSCAINKFRSGTLCRIINYLAKHLKVPGNYRQLFVKDRKEKFSFSQEASKCLKGIPCYPRKICKSLPEHLILPSILPGCFEFVLQTILQNTSISHTKRLIFSVCPNIAASRIPQMPWQKHTSEHLFYRTAPSGCFQTSVISLKGKKQKPFFIPPLSQN